MTDCLRAEGIPLALQAGVTDEHAQLLIQRGELLLAGAVQLCCHVGDVEGLFELVIVDQTELESGQIELAKGRPLLLATGAGRKLGEVVGPKIGLDAFALGVRVDLCLHI